MAAGRRAQILGVAAHLFAQRGFHGVSVTEIGAACGISGPALYKHFPAKDAMLAELLVSVSQELLDVGRERAAAVTPASSRRSPAGRAALEALVAWHTEFALTQQALIVVQDRDWAALPPSAQERVRELQRAYVELWVDVLRSVRTDLGRSRDRARAMVHATFGLLNSTPRSSYLGADAMALLLRRMAAGALLGYVPVTAAAP